MREAKDRARQWRIDNPERNAENRRRWKEKNREKVREMNRQWILDNPDKQAIARRRWKDNNKEWIKEQRRLYLKDNKHKHNANAARRRAIKKNATPSWANHKYMNIFYERAQIESARIGVDVEVDHIVPLQSDIVCGLHCEDNLQLLTASHNRSKQNTFLKG